MEKYLEIGLEILMVATGWEKAVALGHLSHLLNNEDTLVLKTGLMLCAGHLEYRPETETKEDVARPEGRKEIKIKFPRFATVSFTITNAFLGVNPDSIEVTEEYNGEVYVRIFCNGMVMKSLSFSWDTLPPDARNRQYFFDTLYIMSTGEEYILAESSYKDEKVLAEGANYNFEENCKLIRKLLS